MLSCCRFTDVSKDCSEHTPVSRYTQSDDIRDIYHRTDQIGSSQNEQERLISDSQNQGRSRVSSFTNSANIASSLLKIQEKYRKSEPATDLLITFRVRCHRRHKGQKWPDTRTIAMPYTPTVFNHSRSSDLPANRFALQAVCLTSVIEFSVLYSVSMFFVAIQ